MLAALAPRFRVLPTLFAAAVATSFGCASALPPRPALSTRPLMKGPDAAAAPEPDAPLEPDVRAQVLEAALQKLATDYVFPDVASAIAASIRTRMKRGDYDGIKRCAALARFLTEHLREVNHDRHLLVEYSPSPVPPDDDPDKPTDPAAAEEDAKWERQVNHGFERVERLEGNIGYLELRGFLDPALGGETAAAAMTFLADTDALIVDLRRNGGGKPEMVALLSSYLLDGDPTRLSDLYWRRTGVTQQFWTLPFVPGKRFGQTKPLYIVTSKSTFSAAEAFAYDLQTLKRAVVVGETTGGGAHPSEVRRLAEHFRMVVPTGRAINRGRTRTGRGPGSSPTSRFLRTRLSSPPS